MRVLRYCGFLVVFMLLSSISIPAQAQCAMCSANAENSVKNGNTQGRGLNDGILYLLAAPYIAVAAIGFLWYKKYRKRNIRMNIKDEKLKPNGRPDGHV